MHTGLPKGGLLKLSAALRPLTVGKNKDVVTAGEDGDEMYILLKGSLAVLVPEKGGGSGGAELSVVRTLESGASFGEPAAFGQCACSDHVRRFCVTARLRARARRYFDETYCDDSSLGGRRTLSLIPRELARGLCTHTGHLSRYERQGAPADPRLEGY